MDLDSLLEKLTAEVERLICNNITKRGYYLSQMGITVDTEQWNMLKEDIMLDVEKLLSVHFYKDFERILNERQTSR